jgi:hypothetical protein
MRASLILLLTLLAGACAFAELPPEVTTIRIPKNGYAPQCSVDDWNQLHLIYATGDPRKATIHYLDSSDFAQTLEGGQIITESAVVLGGVRNPQLAVGELRCPHFAWMVSPKEFLYTNLTQTNHLNTPSNMIASHPGIDGGAAITLSPDHTFYAAWHAPEDPKDNRESSRKIWVARSKTGRGENFDIITTGNAPSRGVCACCALSAFATNHNLYVLYRCATDQIHRDIRLLTFDDDLNCIEDQTLCEMTANKCIMSTSSFATSKDRIYAAYESDTNVFLHRLHSPSVNNDHLTAAAPQTGNNRKHPALSINHQGIILLAWTENTSFNKPGSIAWQLFTPDLEPLGDIHSAPNLPANSHPATFAKPDGSFIILY